MSVQLCSVCGLMLGYSESGIHEACKDQPDELQIHRLRVAQAQEAVQKLERQLAGARIHLEVCKGKLASLEGGKPNG